MGRYHVHVVVGTGGETCGTQGDPEKYVEVLRLGVAQACKRTEVRINKAGCGGQPVERLRYDPGVPGPNPVGQGPAKA